MECNEIEGLPPSLDSALLHQGYVAQRLASSPSRINRNQAGRFDKLRTGFTLIELVVFIVIVSIAVVGILSVMNIVVKSSADPMIHKQSASLADSILEEILLKAYADPDATEVGETDRDNYDDVDDYHGKSNALFTDLSTELSSYIIGIVVSAPAALNGVSMKKVVVTVTHGAEAITMTGYRANY
jgi:MSHA pilin protein MshD